MDAAFGLATRVVELRKGVFGWFALRVSGLCQSKNSQETSTVWAYSGSGYWGIGDMHFAAEPSVRSLAHVPSFWLHAGFLHREYSILIPPFASPPVIRDKNRMR